jgi:hypothetical protein
MDDQRATSWFDGSDPGCLSNLLKGQAIGLDVALAMAAPTAELSGNPGAQGTGEWLQRC